MLKWLARRVAAHQVQELRADLNGVYVISTPFEPGSDDIHQLCDTINRALKQQGASEVPVIVLPKQHSVLTIDAEQLAAFGYVRGRDVK